MSYYVGFRFGWLRIGRRMLLWHDSAYYPRFGSGRQIGPWKVRLQ
jgi:hypothetical protein